MPGLFILAIILMVIAILLAVATLSVKFMLRRQEAARAKREADRKVAEAKSESSYRSSYNDDYRSSNELDLAKAHTWLRGIGLGFLALSLVITFASSATIVSTKNVGIVTSFGKPSGSLSNGFHLVAPWSKVTELDAAIQTDSHYQNEKPSDCVSVRIVRQAVACVDVSIRWRIRENASDELFKDYRDFANIRDSLVTRELNSTLNAEFQSYDPLGIDTTGQSTAPSGAAIAAKVTKDMQDEIGSQIEVLNVILGVVHFDSNTQSRVDALQAQVAQTRISQQAVITAQQQALANKTLSDSLNNDPNVLVSKCYDLLSEMINKGQAIPAGFSCWPASGSSLVIPSANTGNK